MEVELEDGDDIEFKNYLDGVVIKGKDGVSILNAGHRFYMNHKGYAKTYPDRAELKKKERTFYLGRSEMGEEIFIIIGIPRRSGAEEVEVPQPSPLDEYDTYQLNINGSFLENYIVEEEEGEDGLEEEGQQVSKDENNVSKKDAIKIYKAIVRTQSMVPKLNRGSMVFSPLLFKLQQRKLNEKPGSSFVVSQYFQENVIKELQKSLGPNVKIRFAGFQFGQSLPLTDTLLKSVLAQYDLKKCKTIDITFARDLEGPENVIFLAKATMLNAAMSEPNEDDEAPESRDIGYMYPKILSSRGDGNFQIYGKTALQNNIENGLVKIVKANCYSAISRTLRGYSRKEEPFKSKCFSKLAIDPKARMGKTSESKKLLVKVANEVDIEQVKNGFDTARGKVIPFRFEFIARLEAGDLNVQDLTSHRVLMQHLKPCVNALNEVITPNNIFGHSFQEVFEILDYPAYADYGYALIRLIYEAILRLYEKVKLNQMSIGDLVMIQTLESLILYALNGDKHSLPQRFMERNGIKLQRNFFNIPSTLFNFSTMEIDIDRLAINAEDDRLILPHPRSMENHEFPQYLFYLEWVSSGIASNNEEMAITGYLGIITEEVENIILRKLKRKLEVKETEAPWIKAYLRDEQQLTLTRFRCLLEMGRASKKKVIEETRILTLETFCAMICDENLVHLPYSNALRALLLAWKGERLRDATKEVVMETSELKFEFWFENNEPTWDKVRLIKSADFISSNIREAIERSNSIAEFVEVLNETVGGDVRGWYQETSNPCIIPFDLDNLSIKAYPDFKREIWNIVKRHNELEPFLELYDESCSMDKYIMIWCLKTMIKRTFPVRYPPTERKREKAAMNWHPKANHRKEHFAAALFLTYLVIKSGDEGMISQFFPSGGNTNGKKTFSRWDVTKRYIKYLGIAKTRPVRIRQSLDLFTEAHLNHITQAYIAKDTQRMKELLDY